MAERRHLLPSFLEGRVDPDVYERWLQRKAAAHVRRDRLRELSGVSGAAYRDAIHTAVILSNGLDAYTGEALDWQSIGKYNNQDSTLGRHGYKAEFALLPTVDHVEASAAAATFKICSWRTNDAKCDLPIETFRKVCKLVLEHAGYRVEKDE
jgi:hypothetical protein